MTSSKPLVCVFFKLPPSRQSVLRIHEIAWNVFLPQLNRLNDAFETAQATYPSPEAKKIWSETRRSAAKKMSCLRDVAFMNYDTAGRFLAFMEYSQLGRNNYEAYGTFQSGAYHTVRKTRIAQEVLLKFREDIRIAVDQITTLSRGNSKDISSFKTESDKTMLELAIAVEECNAILAEHCEELKEVQRQSLDNNVNPPSEEEIRMVQGKWLAFWNISSANAYRWTALQEQMQGPEDSDELSKASTSFAMPISSSKNDTVPFWRKFFLRIWS
ncbi:hypothetical protein AGABI1DRAFT_92103 [Agaricus bisporus var. burnettii JB137-S8]|uniref:Uncharacterized protein n=1 Tax=Agaricus bisporus var. burnettii (strain JB137-S8 / ATCC MYA-4627 / FGSC 10392) TaxID=597362 RepID=K5WVZ5_AGABU|nr:uncharacterized protein AGABI1DRAFT_92103 [Agaricus bisporus var. burnettii JB137-S8]EKM79616.1 hypothetical protein AGABI1DRAFT_92103 [Agaricus bisporus var. burnettii JB137-S8]